MASISTQDRIEQLNTHRTAFQVAESDPGYRLIVNQILTQTFSRTCSERPCLDYLIDKKSKHNILRDTALECIDALEQDILSDIETDSAINALIGISAHAQLALVDAEHTINHHNPERVDDINKLSAAQNRLEERLDRNYEIQPY